MFKILPLESEVADRVRLEMTDSFGHRLTVDNDAEGGPCRHCLQRARPGERLILFSHSPFSKSSPYAEVGPIYVHADGCHRYSDIHAFPPEMKEARTLTIRAYDADEAIVDARLATETEVEPAIEAFLEDPRVAFVHARFSAYGCYICRVERAQT